MSTDFELPDAQPGDHDPFGDDPAQPLDLAAHEGARTPLEELRAELEEPPDLPPKRWENPNRPNWAAAYRVDVDDHQFKALQRRSRIKGQRDARGEPMVDEYRLGLLMLGTYNVEISRHGQVLRDSDGDPMTFRSPEWLTDIIACKDVAAGVRKFYGSDGAVISTGRALMQASGYLDDPDEAADAAGPTRG